MTIHITPDSLDYTKTHHAHNVDGSNKLLKLLCKHHPEYATDIPAFLPAPKAVAKPEPVVEVVEPEPIPEQAEIESEDRDWLIVTPRPVTTIKDIQRIVAKRYGFTCMDMLSKRRTNALAKARHVAMYLVKSVTPRTFPEIGRHFGGRDHTTVLYGVRKIGNLVAADEAFRAEVDALRAQFEAAQ